MLYTVCILKVLIYSTVHNKADLTPYIMFRKDPYIMFRKANLTPLIMFRKAD